MLSPGVLVEVADVEAQVAGLLLVLAQSSAIAPFIYTLF